MNLSSLSGESLAAILPPSSNYNLYTLSSTGVVVNFTGKGLFGIASGDSNNIIRLTIDGIQLADIAAGQLTDGLGAATASDRFVFKSSLKVEIITFSSGNVSVTILGA